MSYLALRVVGMLTRGRAVDQAHWVRLPLVVTIYVAALLVSYLAGQWLLPRAIEQGKTLLGQVSRINLEQIREDLLARTLGHMEFARYARSDTYQADLEAFIRDKCNVLTYQEAQSKARQVRVAFEEDAVAQETQKALEKLKRQSDLDELYRQWLRQNRAEQELSTNTDLKRQLTERYDQSFRLIRGDKAFQEEKDRPAYRDERQRVNLDQTVEHLFTTGQYRDQAANEIAARRGRDAYHALPDSEREERFKTFFSSEVPKRFRGFDYTYAEFRTL
jgi:hypothetical protein